MKPWWMLVAAAEPEKSVGAADQHGARVPGGTDDPIMANVTGSHTTLRELPQRVLLLSTVVAAIFQLSPSRTSE